MKYLLFTLASFAATYYLVGLLIQGQLAEIAEGLRHRPDAPTPGQYLREVRPQARRAHRQYTLMAGSVVALVVCLIVYGLS
ncbi:hypothetical protein JET76_25075 [Pseudomonas putida]|uniref:Uncharacterized protein n=1 Tax=Pseudomonas putida TaxID=303 RepID=A0A7W2QM21_PSEPU|nr:MULTISPECIES: hypothetical protein [Pseudomonas]MBA6119229.1 hypothetical protein [Pseudomonas putida]MBI6944597.1 hypothetical protein [Pseudomonas putida]MBI6960900.1 hypothetical protein [Pseudomonas putida]MCZ9639684.1 hypothetical protein [Pseudomonas putida]MEC4878508.1 hypothetical protein [Pseudomonas sp. NC26]